MKKSWGCWFDFHHYVYVGHSIQYVNMPLDRGAIFEQKICIKCGHKIDEIAELEKWREQKRKDKELALKMWKEGETSD